MAKPSQKKAIAGKITTGNKAQGSNWSEKHREEAVEKNLGKSQSLRDFLSGAGWR